MPPRFESRPILNRRALTATLRGSLSLGWRTQMSYGAHLFCIIAANVIARNVANQEVLDAVGPTSLGTLYITVALLSGGLLAGFGFVSRHRDARKVTVVTHCMAGIAMLASALVPPQMQSAALVKYVLMEVSAAALLLVFGRLLGNRFGPREARKIAPRVGAGGIVGGLVAGCILSFGPQVVASRWLFLVAAIAALVPITWLARLDPGERLETPTNRGRDRPEPESLTAYGRALAVTTLIMVATTTLIDYLFRFSAKRYYDADALTQFFGVAVLISGVLALVFQVTLLDRLLDRLGVFATAAVMPVTIAVTGAVFGAAPIVATLLILKIIDSGTNMTVQQSTSSLFLAPLSSRARSVWQGRIDGLARRVGQVVVGLFLTAFPWPPNRVLPLTLALCVLWLISLAVTRLRYIRLLTEMVRGSDDNEPVIRAHDGDTVRLLEAELDHAPPQRAAVILDILAEAGVRANARVLQRLAREGGARLGGLIAVEHLTKVHDAKGLVAFASDPRPEVAVRALVAIAELDLQVAQRTARLVLTDERRPSSVRATAAALLGATEAGALKLAGVLAGDADPITREALALGLAATPAGGPPPVADIIVRLASDSDFDVAARALEALPRHATPEAIEVALDALARPRLRGAAMRALAGVGAIAAERVAQELAKRIENTRIATALTWVLGRLGSAVAVGALMETLWANHPELRLAGAIALSALKRRRAGVVVPVASTAARDLIEIDYYARMRRASHAPMGDSRAARLLSRLFKQRAQASLECLFRLLALRYPEDALRGTLLAVSSNDRRQRQIALELLDTLIEPELRQAIAAAVDGPVHKRPCDALDALSFAAQRGDLFLAALARRVLHERHAPVPKPAHDTEEIDMSDDLIHDILELQAVSLFSQSSAEDLAELATLLVDSTIASDTVICREGDSGDELYLIKSGGVSLSRANEVIDTLGPGDAFGVVSVLDQKPREITATTTTDCVLRVLAGDDLMQLLSERPLFMHSIFRALTESIRDQLDRLALGRRSNIV